jgi:hypothetical protein
VGENKEANMDQCIIKHVDRCWFLAYFPYTTVDDYEQVCKLILNGREYKKPTNSILELVIVNPESLGDIAIYVEPFGGTASYCISLNRLATELKKCPVFLTLAPAVTLLDVLGLGYEKVIDRFIKLRDIKA